MKIEEISPDLMETLEQNVDKVSNDLLKVIESYRNTNLLEGYNLSKKDYSQLKITIYANAIWRVMHANLSALTLTDIKKFEKVIRAEIQDLINEKDLKTYEF